MTDATILIPTYRHPRLLPYALRSALEQRDASVEVFVVGDGVEDDTRAALEPFLADERVRFYDFPKSPRTGEPYRHRVLARAQGRIVCYLSDDDLLLPGHVAEAARLLEDNELVHGPPAWLEPEGRLHYFPWNLAREEFTEEARRRPDSIGITGASHTLAAYRRLPHGWRTTPPGTLTDHYMWLQWLDQPGTRAATGERLTHLWFPEKFWSGLAVEEREAELARWYARSREPGFEEDLQALLADAIRRAAEDFHLWARREQLTLDAIRATRTWRARQALVRLRPLRTLLARRSGGS